MTNLEQTRQAWEEYAEAYDRAITPISSRAAEEALRLAGVGPGVRLLDIASGGGALSLPAARLGADVTAVDYSRTMVALLERKARELGLANLRVREMDGTALEFEDGAFDVTCSVLGIMLFPERARGLAEMARVTRPGGEGVLVAFGPLQRVEVLAVFFQALARSLPGFAPPQNSPLASLSDPEAMKRELEQAGFREVRVQPFEFATEFDSADRLWETVARGAPAIRGHLRDAPPERLRAARAELAEMLRSRGGEGPYSLGMAFNLGIGAKGPA